jgi:cell division protein FtsW
METGFTLERPIARQAGDKALLAAILLIGGLGLANLYSASYGYAISIQRPAAYFAMRQSLWLIPASLVFAACSVIPLDWMRRYMGMLMLAAVLLLLLPFVPGLGITKNGASRWFGFAGLSFQPSELFKPVIILYLAHILSKKADRLSDVIHGVTPPLLVVLAGMALVLLQNDFSSALLIGVLGIGMFWIAGTPLMFFLALSTTGIPLVSLTILTSDYRLRRVLGFLAPGYDPANISYQVNASLRAIRSGGLFGKGIGQGTLKIRSIPEVQSDFVLASWAEEAGFLGMLLLVGILTFFMWRAFAVAFRARDTFSSHAACGMATYIAIQSLINMMVVAGIIPATGIPLPFFSSGGSSLLSVAVACGFIYNISRYGSQEPESQTGHE